MASPLGCSADAVIERQLLRVAAESVVSFAAFAWLQVAAIYRQVKYHNFYHCTDVTHTTFMFIK